MKKTILILTVIVLMGMLATRIYFVNKNSENFVTASFEKGEIVQIEDNFFEKSNEMMNGYNVKVIDSEIVPAEEYLEKFGHTLEDQFYSDLDYYYLVTVTVANVDNEFVGEKGVDFKQWFLQGDDYILRVEELAYSLANSDVGNSRSISLMENSEMEFTLPFYIFSEVYTTYDKLIKESPVLVIASYPTKLMLNIK